MVVSVNPWSEGGEGPATEVPWSRDLESVYSKFHSLRNRATLRTFMLFGAFMYAVFAELDWLRAREAFWELTVVRVVVMALIMFIWVASFMRGFHRMERALLTVGVFVAGAGILVMIDRAGLDVDFYQAGLVQVIMFAAFLLWLPTRSVVALGLSLLAGYAGVVIHQLGPTDAALGFIVNAFFTVGGSALIAIVGNLLYQRGSRRAFLREVQLARELNFSRGEVARRESLLGLAQQQLEAGEKPDLQQLLALITASRIRGSMASTPSPRGQLTAG